MIIDFALHSNFFFSDFQIFRSNKSEMCYFANSWCTNISYMCETHHLLFNTVLLYTFSQAGQIYSL